MKKSDLFKIVKEELKGWSPQIGQTKGLTPDTLNKILMKIASGDDWEPESEVEEKLKEAFLQLEAEKPGLWANIRAKRARGEKPAHKNSKAHKDAVAAGKKINAMSEDKSDAIRWFGNLKYYYQKAFTELKGEDRETYKQLAKEFFSKLEIDQKVRPVGLNENEEWPEEVPSRHGDIIFKLIKVMPDRAKYALIDAETGEEWEIGGRVYNTPDQVKAAAADTIKPQGGRQSSHFGTNESIDKVAGGIPYKVEGDKAIISEPLDDATKERIIKRCKEAGYKCAPNQAGGVTIMLKKGTLESQKVTKEDMRNLVVGLIHEMQNENTIMEKDDRCTRIAKRKYDTWPSAYASGAVVRCRRGEIWKKEK